jgi:hypothetical protein
MNHRMKSKVQEGSMSSEKRHLVARRMLLVSILLSALLAACAGSAPSIKPQGVTSENRVPTLRLPGEAYELTMLATSCWFGGVWSDAEALPVAAWRAADTERCQEVVREVYGKMDSTRFLQLRAFDARVIDDLAGKVGAIAAADPADAYHRDALVGAGQAG